jgi:hypothetical protein
MKPYARQVGGLTEKLSTQCHAGRVNLGIGKDTPTDKTKHCESRPGAKEKIRNAKRAFKKRTRQRLKRDLLNSAVEIEST